MAIWIQRNLLPVEIRNQVVIKRKQFITKYLLFFSILWRGVRLNMRLELTLGFLLDIWVNVFKNRASKICERHPLKIWGGMVCLSRIYHFKSFKACLPVDPRRRFNVYKTSIRRRRRGISQALAGPFLNWLIVARILKVALKLNYS